MKTTGLLSLVTVCAALLHQPASAQTSSQRTDKLDRDRSADGITKAYLHGEKTPAGLPRVIPIHRTAARPSPRTQQGPSHQVLPSQKPADNNPRTNTVARQADSHQTGSTNSAGVPHKSASTRSLPPKPSPETALSGQQFSNIHGRDTSLGIGGAPTNSKNTVALNGTAMKRKP
jgi:hypothetical protein